MVLTFHAKLFLCFVFVSLPHLWGSDLFFANNDYNALIDETNHDRDDLCKYNLLKYNYQFGYMRFGDS